MKKIFVLPLGTAITCSLFSVPALADHLSGGFNLGQSSAILTESAHPLPAGGWFASISTEIVENKNFSDDTLVGLRAFDILEHGDAHDDLHSIEKISNTSLSLAYGFSDNLTLGLKLPYIKRENIREPEEGHAHDGPIILHNIIEHGNSSGIGDATAMGLYRFPTDSGASMALLFGLKMPTGAENENGFKDEAFVRRVDTGVIPDEHGHGDEATGHSHSGTRLETHQQPGSGSWDPILGVVYSRAVGSIDMSASATYTFTNEGSQNTNLGDSFKYNFGLSYAAHSYFDLVLEFTGEWREKEIRANEIIGNSGGRHLYVAPGIRFQSRNDWTASVSYGVPISEHLNGYQSAPDSRLFGSLSFNF